MVELLARNELRQEQKDRALGEAVERRRLDMVEVLVQHGARIGSIPFEHVLLTWERPLMWFFLDHGADPITGKPFAMAFREKVQNALRVFVDYKKAHPSLSDSLQVQADRALRHFTAKGDLKWVSLLMWAGANPRSVGPDLDDRYADDPEPPPIEQYTTSAQRERVTRVQERSAAELLAAGKLSHPVIVQAREVLGRSKNEGLLLWSNEPCMELQVSKAALSRVLKFAAALVSALEEQGFKIGIGNGFREQTTATLYNQQIGFTLVERTDKIPLTAPPKGGVLERVPTYGGTPYEHKATGRFSLRIWKPWNAMRKSWGDGKTRTLEDQLPDVVAGFMQIALAGKAEDENRAAEKAETERIAAERARRAEAIRHEQGRLRALQRAAADWERADRIRLASAAEAATRDGHGVEPGTPFGDWLVWAGQQADRLDPLKESPPSIIDSKLASEGSPRWAKPLWQSKKS